MHPRTKRHIKQIICPIARLLVGYVVMIAIATLAILLLIIL
jgi:hypothetical protein